MSYILGALKKAEKDSKRDKALNFDNWHQEDWSKPSGSGTNNNLILYAVLSTLMLVLIILAWFAYKILVMSEQTPSSTFEEIEPVTAPARIEVIDVSPDDLIPVYVEQPKVELAPFPTKNYEPVNKIRKPGPASNPVKIERNTAPKVVKRPDFPEFSGHIYFSNNSRSSRVFSGANSYREGEEIDGYLIKRIGEGQVTLDFAEKEFRIKLTQ